MALHAATVRIELHIPEARSLKAKRASLRPIIDGLRHRFHWSVAEVDHHDRWQRSTIGVALVASTHTHLEEQLATMERFVYAAPDVEIMEVSTSYSELDEP
jgi:uncharacterized protein YlxP (DUF503 family)